MTIKKPAKEHAKMAAKDRGKSIGLMEPLLISEGSSQRRALTDLALELGQKSAGFRRSLPESLLSSLADLVRSMNCYYSNLIEGHDTHPIDIERALKGDYSKDTKKRDLQLEAKAHIDGPAMDRQRRPERPRPSLPTPSAKSTGASASRCPTTCCGSKTRRQKKRSRSSPANCATAMSPSGAMSPSAPGAVPRFLKRFEEVYGRLGKTETIIAAAAAHHRLAWIHPFLDGNGRVARLMSHATLLEALDTGGVWSIARGLARNVDAYKGHLAACDLTTPQRSRWQGTSERRNPDGIHELLPHHLHRSGHLHGKADAAGSTAHTHPAVGGRRNPHQQAAARNPAPCSKPCSIAANSRARDTAGDFRTPANARPAALSPR